MRCSTVAEDFEIPIGPSMSGSAGAAELASRSVQVAMGSTHVGDYAGALNALRPYLVSAEGEIRPSEASLSQVPSLSLRADLLVGIALVLDYKRRYQEAASLIQEAISLYDCDKTIAARADAYHWLSVARSHQGDCREAERCELKRLELVSRIANEEGARFPAATNRQLSYRIATSRVWLGILALKRWDMAKANAELSAAHELLLRTESGATLVENPKVWGDLHLAFGKLYFAEGKMDNALDENKRALAFYKQSGHAILQIRTRIGLARIYILKMDEEDGLGQSHEKAKRQLEMATEVLETRLGGRDLRSACLLNLGYGWLYLAQREWQLSERTAQAAIEQARRLGSPYLLAECQRTLADALTRQNRPDEARNSLEVAMQSALCAGRYKTVAAVLLSFAGTYLSELRCDRIQFDNYLDRFLEVRSKYRFQSRYLDDLFARLHHERPAPATGDGFYFSCDDLRSSGYDDGLSKFLVWAIHSARRTAHGDVKEICKILHFSTLTRAYKYIKLARAVELGKKEAAEKINKTHIIRRRTMVDEQRMQRP